MPAVSLFDPSDGCVHWRRAGVDEINPLLRSRHYLGPRSVAPLAFAGVLDGEVVACQVWAKPSSRYLPSDGSWLELARWCLTPEAGTNAGSRMHGWVVRWMRRERPQITTLVSYSDPSQGHTGSLYKACNWQWAPTWHRLRPPPSGNGSWNGRDIQSVKDRWVFCVRTDVQRAEILRIKDAAVVARTEAA